eukprot:419833-Prymnesium_polylepis.1
MSLTGEMSTPRPYGSMGGRSPCPMRPPSQSNPVIAHCGAGALHGAHKLVVDVTCDRSGLLG